MKVYIDSREQSRIEKAKQYYTKQGLTVETVELPIGDYIFTNGNESVVFEYKEMSDFIASIQDGRVFNQAISQAEEYNYHFVLIHGNEAERTKQLAISKNYQQVTIYQYLSAIASLNRYTTIIESYSPYINESFYRMLITAKKCLQQKPIVKKFPRKHRNPAFNYLCYCIYGINQRKAKAITDHYDLKSLTDLMKLNIDDLTQIEGIGKKTAENIIKSIKE